MIDTLLAIAFFITDIGDSSVLGLLTLVVAIYLAVSGNRREAGVLLAALATAAITIGVVKILLIGCGSTLHSLGLRTPSGHSALALAVLGTFGLILGNHLPRAWRYVPFALFALLATLIALSRVILKFHTMEEVLVGSLIGCLILAKAARLLRTSDKARVSTYALVFLALISVFAPHGNRLPAEKVITLFAQHFKTYARCS